MSAAARAALVLALLGLSACAHTAPIDRSQIVETSVGRFDLEHAAPDEAAATEVAQALVRAGPKLAQWGTLETPVRVMVEPSHRALEAAVGKHGYHWLRAWARYREVWVQSPRTWSLTGADPAQVDEVLLHELTHCLMYQRSASEESWPFKGIPVWFREGMASYTAGQGYRRGTLDSLRRYYLTHGDDPIADAEALYREHNEVVYSAAYHCFVFLIERYGVEAVKRVLAAMRAGLSFDAAFAQEIGLGRRAFERDFTTYVRLRAW